MKMFGTFISLNETESANRLASASYLFLEWNVCRHANNHMSYFSYSAPHRKNCDNRCCWWLILSSPYGAAPTATYLLAHSLFHSLYFSHRSDCRSISAAHGNVNIWLALNVQQEAKKKSFSIVHFTPSFSRDSNVVDDTSRRSVPVSYF